MVAAPVGAEVEWTVLESSEQRLRLRIDVAGEEVVRGLGPDQRWIAVEIPGAPGIGDPGQPVLPRAARWIALPPEGEARVRIDRLDLETLDPGRVVPAPVPEPVPDPLPGEPRLREIAREGEGYGSFRTARGDVARLGRPSFTRRQRLAALRVDPVLYDAGTGALQIARTLELTVEFGRGGIARPEPGRVESTVAAVVLNPEVAGTWRTLPPRLEQKRRSMEEAMLRRAAQDGAVLDAATLIADPIRLKVSQTGVRRVIGAALLEEGGLPATIARRQLRLVKLRPSTPDEPGYPAPLVIDVPVHFAGDDVDPSASLDPRDQIVFYGLSVEDEAARWGSATGGPRATPGRPDHYNSDNVYFLLAAEPPAEGWARMQSVSAGTYTGNDPATRYTRVEHFEQDRGYQEDPFRLDLERYHWNDGREVEEALGSIRFVNPVPGSDLVVRWTAARFQNISDSYSFALRSEDGAIEIDLGTRLLAAANGGLVEFERQVESAPLQNGAWLFRMRREGVPNSFLSAYFGEVELEYPATYRAFGNRLDFTLPTGGQPYDVRIPGFGRDEVLLFDVSDPNLPRIVTLPANGLVSEGDGFVLQARLDQAPGQTKRFLAAARLDVPQVTTLQRDTVADLFDTIDDVQVLVVGPEEFRSEAERWIDFRRDRVGGRDWNFAYIDHEQIYDHFSGGLQSPAAIRDLAEYAYLQWDARALVLMGDAGEEARMVTGRGSPNRVPISMHIQNFDGNELLASDKWYGVFGYTGGSYPSNLRQTSDIVIGRLPAGDVDELRTMIDKIIAYEQPSADDEWRRRTLWVADDAYSTDSYLGGVGGSTYCLQPGEREFANSQENASRRASGPLDGTLIAQFLDLDDFTAEFRGGAQCADLNTVRQGYEANHRSQFEDLLSDGWLMVSYQGHANFNLLGHENFLTDVRIAADKGDQLTNVGRPYLFFGMGCHISDFCQADETLFGTPAVGETMMRLPQKGALATYGSSGFEFLLPNARFMELITEAMFREPRRNSPVLGDDLRSQWLMGESLAQAELNALAFSGGFDEMVSQYNLLGDPLQRLDAAAPRLRAERGGSEVGDGTALEADAGDSTATFTLAAVDESGVDRIEVSDDRGRSYATLRPGVADPDLRAIERVLELPVYPQDYTVEIAVYDESYPELQRRVLRLPVSLDLRVFANGEQLDDPSQLTLDPQRRTALEIEFRSPVDLTSDQIEVVFEGVDVLGLSIEGGGRDWTLGFDAQPRGGESIGALTLVLADLPTQVTEPDGPAPTSDAPVLLRHTPVPSPFADRTYVTAHVEGTVESARLTVYDLSGRTVYTSDFFEAHEVTSGTGETLRAVTVEWNARDEVGDEVANGTYLYRLEVRGPAGRARSDMGRVVVMR
ncbi:MAG TPA: C25 family cysteine peptidase [Candidatus Krumholzibacteria bacterium]|nr:C25 family cysteine peptidase [Candidatus Krumholzibacteria bacterium]